MCCGWRSAGQRQPGADIALVYHSDRGSVAGSVKRCPVAAAGRTRPRRVADAVPGQAACPTAHGVPSLCTNRRRAS